MEPPGRLSAEGIPLGALLGDLFWTSGPGKGVFTRSLAVGWPRSEIKKTARNLVATT